MSEQNAKDGLQNAGMGIRSFLMVGQSNMAGRGKISEVPPIENPFCYMLRNGRFQKMSEPINPDRGIFAGKYRSGIGLAASFADELQKESGDKIGLIPCADGGTQIEQWMPGEVLFENAVFQAKLAMRSSSFSGILWHQGESNAKEGRDTEGYAEKLKTALLAFRRELQGNFPIVLGEISNKIVLEKWVGCTPYYIDSVNASIHKVAEELENCAAVSAEGLLLQEDGIHFCAASCREFGKRYFAAYRELIAKMQEN